MLKLTIIGRVSDGMPLAQGPRYMNEENESSYKQQGEFLLKEVSRGSLPSSRMTIFLDHLCFNYVVADGICFMALCDSMYPRKLVFYYLQDLHIEFNKFDVGFAQRIITPYSFVKFDSIIASIRRKYFDTRSQTNLSKINSDASQDTDILSEYFSQIVKRRRRFELPERMSEAHLHSSPIWCSKSLEIVALKWIPAGVIIVAVTTLIIWASFHSDLLPSFF